MLKMRSAILNFFFVFVIAFSFSTKAMEKEKDPNGLTDKTHLNIPTKTSYIDHAQYSAITPRIIGTNELDQALSPQIKSPPQTLPGQILTGISSSIGILPAVQVGLPLGMISLSIWGVTNEVLPVNSKESYGVIAVMGIGPLIAGVFGAYQGALKFSQYLKPKVQIAINTTTDRAYTWKEHFMYSYVIPAAQTLFGGSLLFAFVYNLESKVSGWGNPLFWQYGMGLPSFPLYHLLITRQANNPNQHPFWRILRNDSKKDNDKSATLRNIVSNCIEHIKYYGLEGDIVELAQQIYIIFKETQTTKQVYIVPSTSSSDEKDDLYEQQEHGPSKSDEDDSSSSSSSQHDSTQQSEIDLEDESTTSAQNSPQLRQYLQVLKQIHTIQKGDSTLNEWNAFASQLSIGESSLLQLLSLPMMGITTYALQHNLYESFGLSSFIPMWMSTGLTIFPGVPFLLFIATKQLPLVNKEINKIMRGCPPEIEGGFWGQRMAPWLARAASIHYVTLPISQYLIDNILIHTLRITNPYAQIALVTPFAFTHLYIFGTQIFDSPFTHLSNWIATGGEVDLSSIPAWFAAKGKIDLSTRCLSCKPVKLFRCCKKADDNKSFLSKLFCCFRPYKLCCCFGRDGVTTNVLNILGRMIGIKETIENLNSTYTAKAYDELHEIDHTIADVTTK